MAGRESGFKIIAGCLGDKYIVIEYNGEADLLRVADGTHSYNPELHADIDTVLQVYAQLKQR